ncbi:MAG: hypothetical protein ABJA35_14650 [Parafilimonas sp.]
MPLVLILLRNKKMKAAVLHQYGENPKYEDLVEPIPANEQQVLITVKAASVKR